MPSKGCAGFAGAAVSTRCGLTTAFKALVAGRLRSRRSQPQRPSVDRLEFEKQLAELDRLGVADMDRADDRLGVGLDLVHQLHRLEDAERLPRADRVALLDERRRAGLRRAVEGADPRPLDPDEAVAP